MDIASRGWGDKVCKIQNISEKLESYRYRKKKKHL